MGEEGSKKKKKRMRKQACLVLVLAVMTHSLAIKGDDAIENTQTESTAVVDGVENVVDVVKTSPTSENLIVDKYGDGLEVAVKDEQQNKTVVEEPSYVEPPKPEGENPYGLSEAGVDPKEVKLDSRSSQGMLQPMVAPEKPTLLGPAQHHLSRARA